MSVQFSIFNFQRKTLVFLFFVACLVSFSETAQAVSLRNNPNNFGLVGYWPMNDNGGTKAGDASGGGGTGTLTNGPTWTAGKRMGAVSFDGADDYVQISDSARLSPTSAITIAQWIYPTAAGSAGGDLGPLWKGNVASGVDQSYGFLWLASRIISFRIGSASGIDSLDAVGALPLNTWTHVVGVYTGTTKLIYINGVLSDSSATSITALKDTSQDLYIGGTFAVSNYRYFTGKIDETRIYSRALTATQVLALYNSGATSHKQSDKFGLVGHWTFDENGGTVATDFSGRGSSGTLTNGPTFVAGKLGKALSLDGTDDYVDSGSSASLAPSTLSVSFWTKNNSNPASLDGLIAKTNGTTGSQGWGFYYNSASVIRFFVEGWNTNFAFSSISATQWNHVVGTWDGSTIRIYINGAEGTSDSYAGSITTSNPLEFGRFGSNSFNISGLLDDVRIYNRVLTATEVSSLYQARSTSVNTSQNNRLTSGLVGLWSFNGEDIRMTTAYDGTGSNNGTLTNGPVATIGRIGQALRFDGVNDMVVVPHASAIAGGSGSRTFAQWVYISSFPDAQSVTLMSKMYSTVSSEISYSMFIGADTAFYFQTTNGVNYKLYTAPTTAVTSGGWHHIAFAYTWGTGSSAKLYVDGVLTNGSWTVGDGNDTFSDQSEPIEYGRLNHGNVAYTHWFSGKMDELRIYNRILTASEVLQLYNHGK